MLLHLRVHMIPRLSAGGKDIHHRSIGRWIVQASRLQSEDIRQAFQFHRHLTAAARAKPAFNRFASLPNDFVVTRLPANLNRGFWYHHDCGISAAARLLAVPTMTVQHKDWIGIALIMDGAAGAPA